VAQQPLPFDDAPPAAAPVTHGLPAVLFARHRRARRYILRVLPDGTLRVTLPRWGTLRDARRFVEESQAWVTRQRAARAAEATVSRVWREGAVVLVDGRPQTLRLEREAGRVTLWCGESRIPLRGEAPPGDLRPLVERWLRARARRDLPPALLDLAARHGLTVAQVSVRNQQSRWGACSRQGRITLNWRLLQVPPFVREYVLLHELMHLRELNHSPRFWRHVARVCPEHRQARHWLRTEGRRLF
jgi:predicted metal-dependent hydrolase